MITGTLDRYRLLEQKGSGGTGVTWLAQDTVRDAKVVLRIPHDQTLDFSGLLNGDDWIRRLDHPNIHRPVGADRAENTFFVVYELVLGETLRDRLARGEALDPVAAMIEVASALAHAHAAGIHHLRIKPSNLWIGEDGRVRVAEFAGALVPGLAAAAPATAYTPREQLMGGGVAASDVYAAGAVLYELLAGAAPIQAAHPAELVKKIFAGGIEKPSARRAGVSETLEKIVLRAMDPDPARRGTAAELVTALQAARGNGSGGMDAGAAPVAARPAVTLRAKLFDGARFASARESGGIGREPGKFLAPAAVSVDRAGKVYVVDPMARSISVFDPALSFLHRFGTRGSGGSRALIEFEEPSGISFDSEGFVYVVDRKLCRVLVFDERLHEIAHFGRALTGDERKGEVGLGGMTGPVDAAGGTGGRVYVTDAGNSRIRVYLRDGSVVNKFGGRGSRAGEFQSPEGICVDRRGRVCVVDAGNYRLQLFDADGKFLLMGARYGVGTGELFAPTRIACDADGCFYVADYNRIQVFDPNLRPLAEIRNERAARMDKFSGVGVGPDGTVYATDVDHGLVESFGLRTR